MELTQIFSLMGGLGLFLYGMKTMGDGLELAAGSRLKRLLGALTSNRFMGLLVGFIVTAIIQSSSATTVMVVGFVNAGLLSLTQAVGVIMGANIGTTMTSVLLTLDLSKIAPVAIFIGVVMLLFAKKRTVKHIGQIIIGFGVLFLGMNLMGQSMVGLKDNQSFVSLLTQFENPLFGILAGLIITAIIQSSSATVGILLGLASVGAITIHQSVYVLFGQNIGTCVTALLASIGTNKTAKRAALIHLMFNVLGTVIFVVITLLLPFTQWIEHFFPHNVMAQISSVHVVFNIVTTIFLVPFINVLVGISKKIIRGKDRVAEEMSLKYLDPRILKTPPIAVGQVLKEVERMCDLTRYNLSKAMESFINLDEQGIPEILENEKVINFLNQSITEYLVKINSLELNESDFKVIGTLYHVVNDLERIADHAENITEFTHEFSSMKYRFTEAAKKEIVEVNDKVLQVVDLSFGVFKEHKFDQKTLDYISELEEQVDEMTELFKENHIARLNKLECNTMVGAFYVEMLNNLERVSDHATNIAYSVKTAKG